MGSSSINTVIIDVSNSCEAFTVTSIVMSS